MENRWNQRHLTKINVMIYYGPLGLIRGIARDISSHGMFVESGRIILSNEELIQVSFQYPDLYDENKFSIPAHVIHSNQKGAGLKFLNYIFTPPDRKPGKNHYMVSSSRD